jgi:hypothetical protein
MIGGELTRILGQNNFCTEATMGISEVLGMADPSNGACPIRANVHLMVQALTGAGAGAIVTLLVGFLKHGISTHK